MSRAFIKEQDGAGDVLAELPVSPHPNRMTPGGWAALWQQLVDAEERLARLVEADSGIDLERARLERDLRWLWARVASAIVMTPEPQPADRVAFGATVGVIDPADGALHRYRLVGEDETDAEHGWVSWRSPLARAFDGAVVGDCVVWERPAGNLELEVGAIGYQD